MLLQFSVENFRSFKNKTVLSLEPSLDDSLEHNIVNFKKDKSLKVACIFGPNASGKSNIFHALTVSILAIRTSNNRQINEGVPGIVPFLFDDETPNKPSSFEYVFIADGKKYIYGFSATSKKVVEEYLYIYKSSWKSVVFERTDDNYEFTSKEIRKNMLPLTKRNTSNKLFLSTATAWNCNETRIPFNWFNGLINTYNTDFNDLLELSGPLFEKDSDSSLKKFTNNLLQAADINIDDCEFKVNRIPREQLANRVPPEIRNILQSLPGDTHTEYLFKTIHTSESGNKYKIDLIDESNGTKELFMLAPLLKKAFETGETMCVDEFDRSLHPILLIYLVDLFNNPDINVNNAQLIISSHTMSLLSLEHLRRDQVYFVDKNRKTSESELFSLDEFSPRRQENIRKSYLLGRYGSIPIISEEVDLWK